MKAHTYYIIFGRPPIGGEASPSPRWRRHCLVSYRTACGRLLGVVDVVGGYGRGALVVRRRVNPAAAVDSVEVDGEARLMQPTQRHTAVAARTVADQVAADHS